jgi:outer membrane immunogenic protein
MNKILLGSVALATMLAGPAMAADMGVPRAAPVAPPSWTGFYVGGNIGGVWGYTDPGFIASCPATTGTGFPGVAGFCGGNLAGLVGGAAVPPAPAAIASTGLVAANNLQVLTTTGTQSFRNKGWTGGGQIGFNYQYQWAVFGLEVDFEAFKPKATSNVGGVYPGIPAGTTILAAGSGLTCTAAGFGAGCAFGFTNQSDGKWLTTVRGKVGAVWNNWMIYGTVGVAWAKMSFTGTFVDATCGIPGAAGCMASTFTTSQTRVGPVGGAGLSYMLARNWIVSLEYLHVELGGYGGDTIAVNNVGSAAIAPGTFVTNMHYDTQFSENIVRGKIDWKF